jgi:hypothetical protein
VHIWCSAAGLSCATRSGNRRQKHVPRPVGRKYPLASTAHESSVLGVVVDVPVVVMDVHSIVPCSSEHAWHTVCFDSADRPSKKPCWFWAQ